MGVLTKILESKREEIKELRKRKLPPAPSSARPVPLRQSMDAKALCLICEIKLKSPSAGALSRTLSVAERAVSYERAGAWMISVLCDGPFFDGSYEHLLEARRKTTIPLLCKEFVLDECQLDAAAAYGASAVLLIVRCLDDARLARLVAGAKERKLVPLVEIFTPEEATRALSAGADFIGVNSRDLDTLEMNSERAAQIVETLPKGTFRAQLSGVKTPQDVAQVAGSRANAALIGEVLMRQDDPEPHLRSLVAAARRPARGTI